MKVKCQKAVYGLGDYHNRHMPSSSFPMPSWSSNFQKSEHFTSKQVRFSLHDFVLSSQSLILPQEQIPFWAFSYLWLSCSMLCKLQMNQLPPLDGGYILLTSSKLIFTPPTFINHLLYSWACILFVGG